MSWLGRARRELWQRRRPQGLIGWAYLWPWVASPVREHRQIWWQSGVGWPRSLWLLVQGWQWLRWQLWFGPRAILLCLHHRRAQGAQQQGIAPWLQAWRLCRLSLGWAIPPGDVYRFGLHRQPGRALDYVYDVESGYHRWRSAALGLSQASLDLLQDKIALAQALEGRGLPVVATAQVVEKTPTPPPLASLLPGSHPYFCKNRSTNQGRGAFRVWRTPRGLGGLRFEGGHLTEGAAVEAAWRDLCQRDDALIQPDLANHPALEGLTLPDRAITVRYISQGQGHDLKALTATLEVASYEDETTGRVGYSLFPLQVCTGQVLPWPNASDLPPAARQAHDRLWQHLSHPFHLPHWSTLVAASHNAHQMFPDVWAIAWDWVITPRGPVLLEGNSGWGTATPQMIRGGLLE